MSSRPSSARIPNPKEFIFTEKLGSGSYATVYKAYRKTGVREVVAIKCIAKDSLNKASTENLLTEIELLKKLKHEYIVELKDFQWDDHYIYLIMEYCSGGDLSCFIRSKRTLPENVCKIFLQQIAQALQFMHLQKVAHMDLKPQNILLSTAVNPVIKLADFGFAQYLRGGAEKTMLRGSPLYMAPEMIMERSYDAKVDLWSIGVILYECLFGRAPYASRSLEELIQKVRDCAPIEIPYGVEISESCRDLLLRLLQRDPYQRISFREFFSHNFLDLDHMPSSNSLTQAIKLVKMAVEDDHKGHYRLAITWYCNALDYFVPAIKYETNPKKKAALRDKVKQYMDRAEELKHKMRPSPVKRPRSRSRHNNPRSEESNLIHIDTKTRHNVLGETRNILPTQTSDHVIRHHSPSGMRQIPIVMETNDSYRSIPIQHTSESDTVGDDQNYIGAFITPDNSPSKTPNASPVSTNTLSISPNTSLDESPKIPPARPPPPLRRISGSSSDLERSQSFSEEENRKQIHELEQLYEDTPEVTASLSKILIAQKKKAEEDYEEALKLYEMVLEVLMKVLPNQKGKRKECLQRKVVGWMSEAEAIKDYITVQDLNTTDTSERDEQEERRHMEVCSIQ